jgi:hypothetical protein
MGLHKAFRRWKRRKKAVRDAFVSGFIYGHDHGQDHKTIASTTVDEKFAQWKRQYMN